MTMLSCINKGVPEKADNTYIQWPTKLLSENTNTKKKINYKLSSAIKRYQRHFFLTLDLSYRPFLPSAGDLRQDLTPQALRYKWALYQHRFIPPHTL